MAKKSDVQMEEFNPTTAVLDEPQSSPTDGTGSIVLYTLEPKSSPKNHGQTRPALITDVMADGRVSLAVFIGHPEDFASAAGMIPGYGSRGASSIPAYIFPVFSVFGVERDDNATEGTWRPR